MATDDNITIRVRLRDSAKTVRDLGKTSKAVAGVGRAARSAGMALGKAGAMSKRFGTGIRSMGARAKGALSPLRSLGKHVAGLAVAFLGFAAAKEAISTVVTLTKQTKLLGDTYGFSAKAAGEYAAAGEALDVDQKSMNLGFTQISKNAYAAAHGAKKQAAAFKTLGVSQQILKRGNTQEIFEASVAAMGHMKGGTEKAALGMTLFGKSFQKMRPLVSKGIEGLNDAKRMAEEYGAVISDPKAAKEYIHAQHEMHFATLGLKVMLGQKLIPIITGLVKWWVKFLGAAHAGKGIGAQLVVMYGGLAEIFGGLFHWFAKNQRMAVLFAAALGIIVAPFTAIAIGVLYAYTHFKKFHDIVNQVAGRIGDFASKIGDGAIPLIIASAKILVAFFTDKLLPPIVGVFDDLQKTIIVWMGWARTAWAKWGGDITKLALKFVKPMLLGFKLIAKTLQFVLRLLRGDWKGAWDSMKQIGMLAIKFIGASFRALGPLLKLAAIGAIKLLGATLKLGAHAAVRLMWWEFARLPVLILGLGVRLVKAGGTLGKAIIKGMFGKQAANWISGIGKKIGNFLVDHINSALNSISFKFAGKRFGFPKNPIPAFADGGVMQRSGMAMVGERGPELVRLPGGARVTPTQRVQQELTPLAAMVPSMAPAGAGAGEATIIVPLSLDGREVARAVVRHTRNKAARR